MQDELPVVQHRVVPIVMPKQDPTWRFALGARPESRGVVLELLTSDGIHAFGYASDIPHLGYDFDQVRAEVRQLAEQLRTIKPWGLGPELMRLRALTDCNPAFAAVEMAVLDAAGKAAGRPLADVLGGRFRAEVPVLRILSLKDPDKMAANAKGHVDAGYRHLKIKIDNESLDLDAARITAIRDAVGPDVHLTLDANQSYDADGAIMLYERVGDQRIDLFEQPVPEDDLHGLRQVTGALDCIVEADESANSIARVFELISTKSCSGISIKLLKLGGFHAALDVARLCAIEGITCRLGAHVGSRALAAAAMHATAAIDNIGYACELGEFDRLNDDPFEGFEVVDGSTRLPTAPGLGVQPANSPDGSLSAVRTFDAVVPGST